MKYGKTALAAGACAACCAPLVAPLFLGATAVGTGSLGIGLLSSIEFGVLALAIGAGGLWFYRRRSKTSSKATCGCSPDSGCNTGKACDLPAQQS